MFVGFFSPDGFVMNYNKKPVICFGLERFKDFELLKNLFVHEYAHFLLNREGEEIPAEKKFQWLIISEGMAVYLFLEISETPWGLSLSNPVAEGVSRAQKSVL